MTGKAEIAVLEFFKRIGFPGIRLGEGNQSVCDFLKKNNYDFTPDLVAGPQDIAHAPIEGLFFIDVIQPTSDLLFKSIASKHLSINVSETFKKILQDATNDEEKPSINMLPIEHHQCYLDALNKKLDKYSHHRKFTRDGKLLVSANLGIVHHFDLGNVAKRNISDVRSLITLLDYLRFYKSLAPSDNTDLRNAENRLLIEIVNQEQQFPYVMMVGREWSDVPHLFLMIHITAIKDNKDMDISIILVNTILLDNSGLTHPVHKWFAINILNRSEKCRNEEYTSQIITIGFNRNSNIFT